MDAILARRAGSTILLTPTKWSSWLWSSGGVEDVVLTRYADHLAMILDDATRSPADERTSPSFVHDVVAFSI